MLTAWFWKRFITREEADEMVVERRLIDEAQIAQYKRERNEARAERDAARALVDKLAEGVEWGE